MPRRVLQPLLAFVLLGCAGKDGAAVAARPAAAARVSLPPINGPTASESNVPLDSTTKALLAKADQGRIIGSESANVWLIIISDFQCPFCKSWHDETWDAIKKDYVDTGKIRVAYVNLPLSMHRNAWPAAHAAMCAAVQDKFWPMQDALFRTQKEWEKSEDPGPFYEKLAAEAGANVEQLRACVKAETTLPLIKADVDRASSAGAQSTPTFFVGGRPVIGAQPLSVFRDALDAALAAKPAGK
jgi:protein-disulfide isomerase